MNNRRTKLLPKIILGQLFVGLIMAVLGFSILFFAEGYRLNVKNFKIIKTGMASFSVYPRDSKVFLDSKLVFTGSKFRTSAFSVNLTPGYYTARVEHDGFKTWNSEFKIESGFVSDYKSIVLFKSEIIPKPLTDQRKISALNAPVDSLATQSTNSPINIGPEIWLSNKLVTRFSAPVLSAKWYSDEYHILFQIGNEIRVMDKNGSNNILLITLKQDTNTNYNVNYQGDELYYIDGNNYMMAIIR